MEVFEKMMNIKKFEFVVFVGDLEKFKIVILYGVDSVYIGGREFGFRKYVGNFDFDEMKEGIDFVYKYGKKVYFIVNIFVRNEDIRKIDEFFDIIKNFEFDGIIVFDSGIFMKVKKFGILIYISI